jgi:hypothetical protein
MQQPSSRRESRPEEERHTNTQRLPDFSQLLKTTSGLRWKGTIGSIRDNRRRKEQMVNSNPRRFYQLDIEFAGDFVIF